MNKVIADLASPRSGSLLVSAMAPTFASSMCEPTMIGNAKESGPRLRTGNTIDLRAFGFRPAGWRASRERHPDRRGPPTRFVRAHIPGAVSLDVRASLFDDAGDVVSAPELALVMSSIGVGDTHTVVLVGEASAGAPLAAAWALGRYGHRDVHVLEGGFPRWLAEGRAVTREIVRHPSRASRRG